jgi:hypothetical protein
MQNAVALLDVSEELKQEIESHLCKLLKLTTDRSIPWQPLWNSEKIQAAKYYESELICVKGETKLPYTISEIFQLLSRADCRRDMDSLIDQNQRLKWFSPHTGVERLIYKPVWPTDPRDFCNITHWRLLDDGTFILFAFSSRMEELCPEQPKFIRGNLLLGGYTMKHAPGGTDLSLVVQVISFLLPSFSFSSTSSVISLDGFQNLSQSMSRNHNHELLCL